MDAVKNEEKRIQRLIDLTDLPDDAAGLGTLHLDYRGRSVYCYQEQYEHGRRVSKKYLGKIDGKRAREIADLRVRRERLRRLKSNEQQLQKLAQKYQDLSLKAILSDLPKSYRKVAPQNTFDEHYEQVKAWVNADHVRNSVAFPKSVNLAKDGTRVRSKGEELYYNLLQEHSILFLYDCVITIVDQNGHSRSLSPDFLIKCLDGSFIIIEHLGLVCDQRYALDFGDKCYWYLQQGFVLGKNFFVTSDDIHGGTDSQAILQVVKQVERMFFGY